MILYLLGGLGGHETGLVLGEGDADGVRLLATEVQRLVRALAVSLLELALRIVAWRKPSSLYSAFTLAGVQCATAAPIRVRERIQVRK